MSDRHPFRAEWHDYNSGIYFVTICSKDKRHIFGSIYDGKMKFSAIGNIINECLMAIPNHHKDVELWNHVVMPNHIHMVLCVGVHGVMRGCPPVGAQYFAPAYTMPAQNTGCLRPPRHDEPQADNHFNSRLAVIIRSFKAACSIEINRQWQQQNIADISSQGRAQNIAPLPPIDGLWQRNYHEHIIRNQQAFENIMNYIDTNIEKWDQDCFYTNVSIAH